MLEFLQRLLGCSRRRQSSRGGGGESLEPRQLLAAMGNVPLGAVQWQSPDLEINDIRSAVMSQGVVHVVGNEGGIGARQLFTAETGSLTPLEGFWSLHVAQNGGAGGNGASNVYGVDILGDSRVVYLGSSANSIDNSTSPSYWFAPSTPVTVAPFSYNAGELFTSTMNGILSGRLDFLAGVGSMTHPMVNLPGASSGVQILDSTADGKYLVGPGIFRHTGPGELDYVIEFPTVIAGVTQVGSQYFAATEYWTSDLERRVGVWNVETGELSYVTEPGDYFAGIETIEGQLVVAVNGLDGGAIYAGLAPVRNDLSDELGSTTDTIVGGLGHGTLFGGAELGLVVNTGGDRIVSIDFHAPDTVVVITSAIHQGNYAPNVVSTTVSTFEVGLRGSATLDVTKLDRSSLFIGDERNTTSGKIISIKFTDTNKDGFKDAIIKVQTANSLRPDTSRLKITGRTTTGTEVDASRTVTSTSLSWNKYWPTASATYWMTAFTTYSKGLKKTWW